MVHERILFAMLGVELQNYQNKSIYIVFMFLFCELF